ncbi:hypothetical protein QAD02_018530 [Eretmocerus hayati]|uniref:Uncharacterized protein n=1 Tax=Eretmocerus hayati TaxID=131215 RepID=A0ACC2PI60_9HYME|nr:hypothetical protein QAD02_018530 [Eretmocerus hayati]
MVRKSSCRSFGKLSEVTWKRSWRVTDFLLKSLWEIFGTFKRDHKGFWIEHVTVFFMKLSLASFRGIEFLSDQRLVSFVFTFEVQKARWIINEVKLQCSSPAIFCEVHFELLMIYCSRFITGQCINFPGGSDEFPRDFQKASKKASRDSARPIAKLLPILKCLSENPSTLLRKSRELSCTSCLFNTPEEQR